MSCWLCLVVVLLAFVVSHSNASVTIPYDSDLVAQGKNFKVRCTVNNEKFSGWYLGGGGQVPTTPSAQVRVDKYSSTEYDLVVQSVKISNGGQYVCRGDSGQSKTFTLNVEFSSTHVKKTQYLRLGTNDKIRVDVIGVPQPVFTWKKGGVTFDANQARYSLDSRGTISIRDVKIVDKGNFSLHISQMNGRTSEDLKIEVVAFEPPIMVEVPLPATRYLTVGFNTTFHCRAKGYPPPQYTWLNRILSEIDLTNPRFILNGEYFTIADIQQSDQGKYTCVATNVKAFKVNATVEIKEVYVRPTIQSQYIVDEIVERGENAILDCVADGKPLPVVRWMRDGRFEYRQKQSSRRSVIRIQQARMTDMGRYQCEAMNIARDQSGHIIVAEETMGLYIKSKPIVNPKGTPLTVYSYLGNPKPVFIRCNFEGYPFPNVTIWFDNIQIANGTDVAIFDIITNELLDFGPYYCWSWNLHGSRNVTVQLKHATPPSRPTNVVANVTCDRVKLTWDIPKDNGGMEIVHYVLDFDKQRWNTEDTYPLYYIENLKRGTVYTIQLRARNKMGVGDHETVTVTTSEYCRPGHPIIWHPREKVIEDTVFFLRWREPKNNGGDPNVRYKLIISEDLSDGPYPIKHDETGVTEYYVDELKFGMRYQIEVIAYNKGGYSDPAIGLYEVPNIGVRQTGGRGSSSCLSISIVTMLVASLVTLTLTNL